MPSSRRKNIRPQRKLGGPDASAFGPPSTPRTTFARRMLKTPLPASHNLVALAKTAFLNGSKGVLNPTVQVHSRRGVTFRSHFRPSVQKNSAIAIVRIRSSTEIFERPAGASAGICVRFLGY
jgi:hypothetical protein